MFAAAITVFVLLRPSGPGGAVASRPIPSGKRPLLLVTFDTTRADHLSPWGADPALTPNLQQLADNGIVFDHAYSVAPITLPAHTSILTGQYPFEHGVRNNGLQYVPQDVTTLAEHLGREGFRTGAFVSAAVLDGRYDLDQGFEVYDDDLSTGRDRTPRAVADRPAEAVVDSAHAWLDTLEEDENFFLWVHFYDPHAPYSPPAPYRDQYRERLYDGEIAYMDAQMGRLFRHPMLDIGNPKTGALTMVIGDHGESLGEHGERTHALLAYDSTLHVPWIMRVPGGPAGVRVADPVSQVDLMPTVLDLLEVRSETAVSGRSLAPLIEGASAVNPPAYYSETYLPYYTYGWAKLRALRRGSWKYIDAPKPELYNLRKDPRELTNVHASQPGKAHDLKRDLDALLSQVEDPEAEATIVLDSEAAEQLRSLGYLSVGSRSRDDGGSNRDAPDPKDLVDLHVALEQGRALLDNSFFEQAEQQFRTVLRRDPNNLAGLIDLITAVERQGEVDEAVSLTERALELDPDYDRLYMILARLEVLRGEPGKALELVDVALGRDPKNPDGLAMKSGLLMRLNRSQEAGAVLGLGLEDQPDHPRLNALYARTVEMPAGKLAEAEERLQLAAERDPFLALSWVLLGQVQERTGRSEAAIQSYRTGLQRRSDDVDLHSNLGRLLARTGQQAEAEPHLREALRLAERFQPDLHVALGGVLAESGRFEEAQKEYDKVLAVRPKHPGARNNAAIALYRSGRTQLARTQLQELLVDFPLQADAHNNLAAIAVDRAEWRAAEFHSRKALEINDSIVEAWNNLAVAREQQGDLKESRQGYERALALDQNYWPAHFNMGILLQKVGDPAAAAASFAQVLERIPNHADAHLVLGDLYAGPLSDPTLAKRHWNALLRYSPEHPKADEVRERVHSLPAESG